METACEAGPNKPSLGAGQAPRVQTVKTEYSSFEEVVSRRRNKRGRTSEQGSPSEILPRNQFRMTTKSTSQPSDGWDTPTNNQLLDAAISGDKVTDVTKYQDSETYGVKMASGRIVEGCLSPRGKLDKGIY